MTLATDAELPSPSATGSSCGTGEAEDEYVIEETEELVVIELQGVVQSEITQHNLSKFKLLGAFTPNPVLQVGSLVFQGKLEPTMGTAVIFREDTSGRPATLYDPVFGKRTDKSLQYYDKTQQCFKMKRVFIKKKRNTDGGADTDEAE